MEAMTQMNAEAPLIVERHGKVLEITMNRPPVNAINSDLSDRMYEAFRTLRDDPELTLGLVTGTGERCFSAGWDLKEVTERADEVENVAQLGVTPGGFAGYTEMWDLNKPVIAAVNGATIGGGFEVALAADIILAADHAEFWLPEMERGLLADAGAIQRLPRLIPYNVAMELLYTGRRMGAQEAKHWGLVHEVLPLEELMPRARELAAQIADGAPLALQALKEVVPAIVDMPLRDAFARLKPGQCDLPIYTKMLKSEDFLEGPRAFAEKRKPVWKGR